MEGADERSVSKAPFKLAKRGLCHETASEPADVNVMMSSGQPGLNWPTSRVNGYSDTHAPACAFVVELRHRDRPSLTRTTPVNGSLAVVTVDLNAADATTDDPTNLRPVIAGEIE